MDHLVQVNLKEFRISKPSGNTAKKIVKSKKEVISSNDISNVLDDILDHKMQHGGFLDPEVLWCERKIGDLNLADSEMKDEENVEKGNKNNDESDHAVPNNDTVETDLEEDVDMNDVDELIGELPSTLEEEDMGVDTNNQEDEKDISVKKVLKAMISPTELGVSIVKRKQITQKGETSKGDIRSDSQCSGENTPLYEQQQQEKKTPEYTTSSHTFETQPGVEEPSSNTHNSDSNGHPYKFEINNHYYNYIYQTQEQFSNENRQLSARNPSSHTLPDPWSKKSHPHSKFKYLFTSYLQLFLNSLMYMGLGSLLLMFLKAFYHDLQSSWNQEVLKLHYESSVCKFQHLINKCSSQKSPALQEKCLKWSQCMSRDNNNMYIGKTTSIAKLIGSMINGLVEPIGWKPVLVFIAASYLWIFGLNFLLGFVRARSYFDGKSSKPDVKLQEQDQHVQDPDSSKGSSKYIAY